MSAELNFKDLLISVPFENGKEYESTRLFEEEFPHITWLTMNFALEQEDGDTVISLYGDDANVDLVGHLDGAFIFGAQAYRDRRNIVIECDDCNADLCEVATDLEGEGLIESPSGMYVDVLYIHKLELSREAYEAANLQDFFDKLPHAVYQHVGVMPELCCYLADAADGYYASQEQNTKYDPRSVGKDSIQMLMDNGYRLTSSHKLLYRYSNAEDEPTDMMKSDEDDAGNNMGYPGISASFAEGVPYETFEQMRAEASRDLLEDYTQIGYSAHAVHISRNAPKKLVEYVQAAIAAHNLGTPFDYALRHLVSGSEPDIPDIHLAFQRMYFAGKQHMEDTMRRMHPEAEPNAGEVYSDVALTRAKNTYYVAAMLYREGHMIEAHAMSRLMLEQIAWAYNACKAKDLEEAEKISPTKSIGRLKTKIKPVGRLYGALCEYVHLPLKGHYEFIDLSSGESSARYQFGVHSYNFGQIISYLADYWACVYEYTQANHFESLENWLSDSSGFMLNPERPFLAIIEPMREEITSIYASEYPSYADYLKEGWRLHPEEDEDISN